MYKVVALDKKSTSRKGRMKGEEKMAKTKGPKKVRGTTPGNML